MRHENLKLFALEIVPKYLLLTRGRPVSLARNLVPSWSVQVVNRYFIIKQKMHYVTEAIARPEAKDPITRSKIKRLECLRIDCLNNSTAICKISSCIVILTELLILQSCLIRQCGFYHPYTSCESLKNYKTSYTVAFINLHNIQFHISFSQIPCILQSSEISEIHKKPRCLYITCCVEMSGEYRKLSFLERRRNMCSP